MTEKQLEAAVRAAALALGYLYYHTHDSRRSNPGFPDCVMVHPRTGALLFWELKSERGRPTGAQMEWMGALHQARYRAFPAQIDERIVYPSSLNRALALLTRWATPWEGRHDSSPRLSDQAPEVG